MNTTNSNNYNLQHFSFKNKTFCRKVDGATRWFYLVDIYKLLGSTFDELMQLSNKEDIQENLLRGEYLIKESALSKLFAHFENKIEDAAKKEVFFETVYEFINAPTIENTANNIDIVVENLPLVDFNGAKLVDSRVIADALGVAHKSLQRLINEHKKSIEKEFGRLRFEIAVAKNAILGSNPPKYTLLTEDQALFIGALSRNNPKVFEFKARLVKTFQEMRQAGSKIVQAVNVEQKLHGDILFDKRIEQLEQSLTGIVKVVAGIVEGQNKIIPALTVLAEKIQQPTTINPNAVGPQKPIKQTKASGEELLTAEEVADILKVSVNTLRNWRYLGTGPVTTPIGKQIRYKRSAVQDYIDSNVKKSEVDMGKRANLISYLTNVMNFSTLPRVLYEDVSLWQVSTMTSQRMEAFKELFGYDEGKIVFEDDIISRGLKLLYESITKE